jgi:hypothetical protein
MINAWYHMPILLCPELVCGGQARTCLYSQRKVLHHFGLDILPSVYSNLIFFSACRFASMHNYLSQLDVWLICICLKSMRLEIWLASFFRSLCRYTLNCVRGVMYYFSTTCAPINKNVFKKKQEIRYTCL